MKVAPGMVIVTQAAGQDSPRLRVNSRVFVPSFGIDEDPAVGLFLTKLKQTGSAQAYLTGYYLLGPGRNSLPEDLQLLHSTAVTLDGMQLSSRGAKFECRLLEDEKMVEILGLTHQWAQGRLGEESITT